MAIEEQFILLSLGLVTIAVRVSLRWQQVGPSGWQLDDYLMPLTGVVFTLEVIAAHLVGAKFQGLTNSYMTDAQRAAIDPNSQEYYSRQWGSKIQVIGWSFYASILWALKFCVATFYSRLTGAIFVIMAGTIRAVVILTSGPEGALSGSSWACRETFVAIVVTNLPILQPLMRRGASKIGLTGLFRASGSMFDTRRKQDGSRCHPLSNSHATAWGSEERILDAGIHGKSTATKGGGIVVAQEVCVESEHVSAADSGRTDPAHDDW
ncbi:hypothetical protein EDB81DRAFT_952986 [Dactylonectria macrodidyma]|uniref:Uncharacterized protein n=1 Tax=Dactylonectria macrodidyma TaxID=307937 RepID=A0A9P9DBM7_9HYPO|nr:hypothetical protein EDB81DRAFT_952986 [Dactylonectria macrodidyma]